MTFTVDQCKHFDGKVCKKCKRLMPDTCKAQDDMEEKAAKYDELIARTEAKAATVVQEEEPQKNEDLTPSEPKKVPLPPAAKQAPLKGK